MKILGRYFLLALALFCHTAIFAQALKLKIKGVDKNLEENIYAKLGLESLQNESINENQLEQILFNAKKEVQEALIPFGYYHPDIQINSKKTKKNYWIYINITLNTPVRVHSIYWRIEGDGEQNLDLNQLFTNFPLKIGDALDHEKYESAKRNILTQAYFSGFVKAEFSIHEIQVDLESNQADIYLTLNTDNLYTFENVTFSDPYFDIRYLNRFVPFETNTPFEPDELLSLQRNLTLSDQFSHIHIEQTPNDDTASVPINVILEKAKPNKYTLGAGYGTDTGVRGLAGWERRWVNRFGHKFSIQGHLSEIYNQGYMEYKIPGRDPVQDYIALSATTSEDEYLDKESRVWQLGVSNKRTYHYWNRIVSLYYREESFKEFESILKKNEKLLLPTLELSHIHKNDPINPSSGHLFSMKLTGSINTLLSDASFAQISGRFNWLKTHRKHSLLFRTQLGATVPQEIEKLPLSMRFYAGGDNSLRGFGYRSLPIDHDAQGEQISVGGAYLAIASLEWEYRIKSIFGVATFIDTGNAFRGYNDQIETSIGIGFRWHTPIGPLKVDLAKSISTAAHSPRLHITFGTGL